MLPRWGTVALSLAALFGLAAAAPAADESKPVRVLFVLGSPPFHDIRTLPPVLEKALHQVGGFEVTRLEPPQDKKPDDAAHLAKLAHVSRADYDVLLFYTSAMQLTKAEEAGLKKFLDEGGGIVGLHGASLSFGKSQFWTNLIGARFTGHIPGTHKLHIVIVDKSHPITAGLHDFSIVDEEYKHRFAPVEKHVLLRFRERPPQSDQKANMDIAWTRKLGNGRVFYCALGHDKQAWENPSWQKLVAQGILWAAGRPREVHVAQAAAK